MKTVWAFGLSAVLLLCGCTVWNPLSVRSQSPDAEEVPVSSTRLVGDLAVPYGLHPISVEAVGFVIGLKGTGCDPRPSQERSLIMHEMQRQGIERPNALLASLNTSLVKVRGFLRPGIQKNDRFDLEVRIVSGSGELYPRREKINAAVRSIPTASSHEGSERHVNRLVHHVGGGGSVVDKEPQVIVS